MKFTAENIMQTVVSLLLVTLCSILLLAQDKKADRLPELQELRVGSSFQHALLLQQQLITMKDQLCANYQPCANLQNNAQQAAVEFNTQKKKALDELKEPEGTDVEINPNTLESKIVRPPVAAPKTPEKTEKASDAPKK